MKTVNRKAKREEEADKQTEKKIKQRTGNGERRRYLTQKQKEF